MKAKPKRKPRRGPVFPNKPKIIKPKPIGLWDVGGAGVALTQQAIESRSDLEVAWTPIDEPTSQADS